MLFLPAIAVGLILVLVCAQINFANNGSTHARIVRWCNQLRVFRNKCLIFRNQCLIFRNKCLMVLNKARMLCLIRGYYAPNKVNLMANFWLFRATINHPVKVVKVFKESFHVVKSNAKIELLSNAEKVDAPSALSDPLNPCQKSNNGQKSLSRLWEDGGRL